MHKTLSLLLCLGASGLMLSACSGEEQPKIEHASPFAAQTEALQKAQQTEKIIQDADADRRRQLQQQGL